MNYQTGITKTKHVVLPERKLGGKNKVKHFKKEPPLKKKKKNLKLLGLNLFIGTLYQPFMN